MISKKDLAAYNFESIEDYYNYIVESEINGQFEQMRELIGKLNKNQYMDFMIYLQDNKIDIKKFIR